jgi:non-ribosomal peptide synthetase component F
MYGITETTVHVTFRQLTEGDCNTNHLTAYVCNGRTGLQRVGVPDELYIGRAGLARA